MKMPAIADKHRKFLAGGKRPQIAKTGHVFIRQASRPMAVINVGMTHQARRGGFDVELLARCGVPANKHVPKSTHQFERITKPATYCRVNRRQRRASSLARLQYAVAEQEFGAREELK